MIRWTLPVDTLRLFGCCRTSVACFCRSSCSRRLLYSIWLVSSVWCWVRISSARVLCTEPSCLNSSSCVDSWWRSSMAHSRSFWVCFLFRSWRNNNGENVFMSHNYCEIKLPNFSCEVRKNKKNIYKVSVIKSLYQQQRLSSVHSTVRVKKWDVTQ